MPIYAIGDIQGQFEHLLRLLDLIKFDQAADQLWLAGDLVNRGPSSLETLRFVKGLGSAAKTVMGNHDLHLLGVAAGTRKMKRRDTFAAILAAPDREELLFWLRHRPFIHQDKKIKTMMVHAGVHVKWTRKDICRYAKELESTLQGKNYIDILNNIRTEQPVNWKKSLKGWERYRCIADVCTRMRFCSEKGRLDFKQKGHPGSQPANLTPWFRLPKRRCKKWRIIFGHWATLGYLNESNVMCLDSGCVWGRELTAVRLDIEREKTWQLNCD